MRGVTLHEALVFRALSRGDCHFQTTAEVAAQLQGIASKRSTYHQVKKLFEDGLLERKWIAPEFYFRIRKTLETTEAVERMESIKDALQIVEMRGL